MLLSTPCFQEPSPQAFNIDRQLEVVNFPRHFIQVQPADILRSAMRQNLLQVPTPLKWIVKVDLVCAPYQVTWRLNLSMHNLIIQQIVLFTPGTKKAPSMIMKALDVNYLCALRRPSPGGTCNRTPTYRAHPHLSGVYG
jgi:hypothetical protein